MKRNQGWGFEMGTPSRVGALCVAVASVAALASCAPQPQPVTTAPPPPTAAPPPTTSAASAAPAAPAPRPAPVAELVKLAATYDTDNPNLNVLGAGEKDCPAYKQAVLREPTRIRPRGGVVGTNLIVAMKSRCVPYYVTAEADGTPVTPARWENRKLTLRTYGFPRKDAAPIKLPDSLDSKVDLDDPSILWSSPGPTFELRKGSKDGKVVGTKFDMTLINAMPSTDENGKPLDFHACDTLEKLAQPGAVPPAPGQGPFHPDDSPNCFHGDNSTNFHMHGSHVSPQEHQDFVGLELLPWMADASKHHATHGAHGLTRVGAYHYDVDPLRYEQAEGTHWYHAHKHGATALQVLNGLSGAFLVRGEFDDALEAYFKRSGNDLTEHLLVVQQIQEKQSGLAGGEPPTAPLVNGQGNPIIQMKPGEIQRWRFVGATQNAGATFTISLPADFKYAQIALDGVEFSPQNYVCQPILSADGGKSCKPKPTSLPSTSQSATITLSPGMRIDMLVQAPTKATKFTLGFKTPAADSERLKRGAPLLKAGPVTGDLITVEVVGTAVKNMTLPTMADFPPMPDFLADIAPPTVKRTVAYSMTNRATLDKVTFLIDGAKYNPDCANETLTLGVAEEWTLTNDSSAIPHPFHIHTNPFQVISQVTWDTTGKKVETKYPYPFWRDTMPLALASTTTPTDLGQVVIRYMPQNFTGGFVNHCHILGHEDRGMMQNVQTVCKPDATHPGPWYGKPSATVAECKGEESSAKPLPACTPSATK